MKKHSLQITGAALALALTGGVTALPSSASAAAACDRACLRGVLDQYLVAVLKHDPKAAPIGPGHKTTSNAEPLVVGEGIWRTATAYGPVQRRYIDTVNGSAAYFGHLMEGDVQDVVSLRIKVVNRKVTEAEWVIARKSDGAMFNADGLKDFAPPDDKPLPIADRTPRAQMIAAGEAYFDGLETHDGAKVPHENGCERIENGFKVTNRVRTPTPPIPSATPAAAAPAAAPSAAEESRSGDCAAGFDGFARTIAKVSPRRYTMVDEVTGVTLGAVMLLRPPGVTMKRNLLNEYFYTKRGKISAVYAAMYYVDDKPTGPGW